MRTARRRPGRPGPSIASATAWTSPPMNRAPARRCFPDERYRGASGVHGKPPALGVLQELARPHRPELPGSRRRPARAAPRLGSHRPRSRHLEAAEQPAPRWMSCPSSPSCMMWPPSTSCPSSTPTWRPPALGVLPELDRPRLGLGAIASLPEQPAPRWTASPSSTSCRMSPPSTSCPRSTRMLSLLWSRAKPTALFQRPSNGR